MREREYGFDYATLINALRAAMPASVEQVVGRVATVANSSDRQRIEMADGRAFEGRLVIVATGVGEAIRNALGVRRVVLSKTHSLAFGFTMARPAADYDFESMTWYGDGLEDKLAYVTFFKLGKEMRVNMFAYREANEEWSRRFRSRPAEMLRAMMPDLAEACHGFEIKDSVSVRPVDITESRDYLRDGVVFVGDAFRTTCPAPGIGFSRVLTDVDRLCNVHVANWFATPGMGVEKIGAYYEDSRKLEVDTHGVAVSMYSRRIVMESSPLWLLRRARNKCARFFVRSFRERFGRLARQSMRAAS
jgi:2-polyprenyl-6-methoxyphenol hydroxylase-like FAD-dependent oxidoreductase